MCPNYMVPVAGLPCSGDDMLNGATFGTDVERSER